VRHARIALMLFVALSAAGAALAEQPNVLYETTLAADYYIPHAHDIAVDEAGNAYLIASAYENHTSLDVIVVKLDPEGNEVWTYDYAHSGHSYATGIAIDASGHPWVTGWTDDPSFPLVDPIDSQFNVREIFVMKFDPADGGILYSTFIGGDYTDTGEAIAINEQGEIIIGGTSGSTDFPTTADAWQAEPSAPLYIFQDGIIVKLSPAGDQILYATYFGGFEDDWIDSMDLDGQGNIIVGGRTNADDFPLAAAIESTPNELFISKLSADGQDLLFSTYFGGSDIDRLSQLESDAAGRICVAGITRSVDLPTTPGTVSPDFVGAINGCEEGFPGHPVNCEDFFVFRLGTSGEGILWGTYLGGTVVDESRGIACDELGNVFVTGYTGSDDFPLYDGTGASFVVCKLTGDASEVQYTHYVESGSANRGNGIFVDAANDIYFTGTVGVPASIYISKLEGERTTAVDDGRVVSLAGLELAPNYPNPFNPRTNIQFSLPEGAGGARAHLRIYDAAGRLVRQLLDESLAAGEHSVAWSGRDDAGRSVSAGVYYARLSWAGEVRTRSMVLLK
jgi:hypothetical protein